MEKGRGTNGCDAVMVCVSLRDALRQPDGARPDGHKSAAGFRHLECHGERSAE